MFNGHILIGLLSACLNPHARLAEGDLVIIYSIKKVNDDLASRIAGNKSHGIRNYLLRLVSLPPITIAAWIKPLNYTKRANGTRYRMNYFQFLK